MASEEKLYERDVDRLAASANRTVIETGELEEEATSFFLSGHLLPFGPQGWPRRRCRQMSLPSIPVYNLFIINKSGGLIYYKDFGSLSKLNTNESLRLASTWHGLHAISMQLSPVGGDTGIEVLEADTFDLHNFQTLTGTKFFVATEVGLSGVKGLLAAIYDIYTDYVLKNPFYEVEMPIRCELFDHHLLALIKKDKALLGLSSAATGAFRGS